MANPKVEVWRDYITIDLLPYCESEFISLDAKETEQLINDLKKNLAILRGKKGDYRCVVCQENPVSPDQGEDTCPDCCRRI